MESVIKSILHSIQKNGYPGKRVALPFKPIFDACKQRDVSLTSVLKKLEEQEVCHDMKDDRILFYARDYQPKSAGQNPHGIPDDLYKAAMDKLKGMDPEEVEKMKKKVMEMSPEEQQELLKKAKDLFGNT